MVEKDEDYEVGEDFDPEAENFDWAGSEKKLALPETPLATGEEDEEQVAKYRCKLYRWVKTEWKERGTGDLRFLKNKSNNRIRIALRQDKTHKVVANFNVAGDQLCQLTRLQSNDKSWTWLCYDASDLPPTVQKLCGRFVSKEDFESFQVEFEKAYKHNTEVIKASPAKTEDKKEEPAKEEPKAEEAK